MITITLITVCSAQGIRDFKPCKDVIEIIKNNDPWKVVIHFNTSSSLTGEVVLHQKDDAIKFIKNICSTQKTMLDFCCQQEKVKR